MKLSVYNKIKEAHESKKTLLAVLIDPDKENWSHLEEVLGNANEAGTDLFFVGGSLLTKDNLEACIDQIRIESDAPTVIFPGSIQQVSDTADALLFLSVISGRNPDLLIGQHVAAAPLLKQMDLEVMPTGYMIIDGGKPTTVSYISNTHPIPADKPSIAACTAMAGEMLGLKLLYLDCGSGAAKPVSAEMVAAVKAQTNLPIIVGGGIKTAEKAKELASAGASVIVIGNAIEENPQLVKKIAAAIHA